jgi:hypothetical protein
VFRPRLGHPQVHIEINCTNNFIMFKIFCVKIHKKITLKLEALQQLCSLFITNITYINSARGRSRWPRGLRRRSAAARLLRLWVRFPPGCMDVYYECCVLSGRRLCDGLTTRQEDPYRVRRVVVCDLETSRMRRPWTALSLSAMGGGAGENSPNMSWHSHQSGRLDV